MAKKYPPTDPQKECPLGTLHVKNCPNCRLAIPRYSQNELIRMKHKGNLEAQNEAYSCSFLAILYELRKLNAKLSVPTED